MAGEELLSTQCWMGELPQQVREAPLLSLCIPGTHNSFTYTLERTGTAGPDQPGFVKQVITKFPGISSKTLHKWSVTQVLNLSRQLESGVRYFDIRLQAITEEDERVFKILHCLLGTDIVGLMKEVKSFLDENTSEVVILDFQRLYEFEEDDHVTLIHHLQTQFQDLLCSWGQDISRISLASLQDSGTRLILLYPSIWDKKYAELRKTRLNSNTLSFFWGRNFCPNPWPDTASTTTLREFLSTKLEERDPKMLFISQGILTPDWKTILFRPLSDLDSACAKKCNLMVKEWLKGLQEANKKPNIVITDFVGRRQCSKDIINTLIKMNHEWHERTALTFLELTKAVQEATK